MRIRPWNCVSMTAAARTDVASPSRREGVATKCELCICNIDPSCCTDEWTELWGQGRSVLRGMFMHPLLGGDWPGWLRNPGCGDIGCQDCVCEQDDCCSVARDLGCTGLQDPCLDECNCEAPPAMIAALKPMGIPLGDPAWACVCDSDPACCSLCGMRRA